MIFAQIRYPEHYSGMHDRLRDCIGRHFSQVRSGLQGDSWIEILDGGIEVAIDTFTSMQHQVKSPRPGPHVERVIEVLRRDFELEVLATPELEGHEPLDGA